MGLLVRIFRSTFSLRVEEGGRLGRHEAGAADEDVVAGWLLYPVRIEEVVDVEACAEERWQGLVVNQIIEVRTARVGGIEKPSFKDKAIRVSG